MIQGPVLPPPDASLIHRLFERQVEQTPDAIAVEENGRSWTYSELNARSNQVAWRLRELGVEPGKMVGILLERSATVVAAIYGTLKAGGAYVPLDPAYPQDRLRYMIESAKLSVLVTLKEWAGKLSVPEGVQVVCLDTDSGVIEQKPITNPAVPISPDALIYVIFTSGSTGKPKGAAVYHRGFANLLHWFVTEFEIGPKDRALLVSSLSFDLTQKNLYATLIRGGSLHIYRQGPFDVALMTEMIESRGITLVNCTPSAFYPLIEPASEATFRRIASLRVVYLGGEPISVTRVRPWITNPHCRGEIANTYGPTECTDICGAYRLTRTNLDAYPFVPLGRPVYNVQLGVLDADLKPCPPGVSGELVVGGEGVGAGYINDAELTAAKFLPNTVPGMVGERIYKTGDQGRWMPDGVIEFLGRLDHQVKIRGFRIELHEIEAAMSSHPEVREAIVVVKPPVSGGDPSLAAFLTTRSDNPLDPSALRAHLASRIPDYMIPVSFRHLDAFPLSPNGKVDRKALRELSESTLPPASPTAGSTVVVASGSGKEVAIKALWTEILGQTQIDPDAQFFDLGGDSIKLARLHVGLQQLLGREFPITDLFTHTSLRAHVRHFLGGPSLQAGNSSLQDRARMQREALANRRPHRR